MLFLVVTLVRLVPGDVIDALIGDQGTLSPQLRADLEKSLGIDRPIYLQYLTYLGGAITGDLGTSIFKHRPVLALIAERLPLTIQLAASAIALSLVVALPAGILAALNRGTAIDYAVRFVAVLFLAVPGFIIATYSIVIPAITVHWRPPPYVPFVEDPFTFVASMIFPVCATAAVFLASQVRMVRSSMLEVLRQDYIRTARAKGLPWGVVIRTHALKNSLIPSVTLVGIEMATLLGGTVIIEQVFSLPGIGDLLLTAFNARDYPVIQGVTLVLGVFVILVNVLVDITYSRLDPRIAF